MKKLFLIITISIILYPLSVQSATLELVGIWKKITTTSGSKLSPTEYILLTDDSIYVQGVDSIGNSLSGVSSGRGGVRGDSTLILYPSDRIADTRYFKLSGENRYTFESSKNERSKKSHPAPEIQIYLEKCIRKEGQ